MKSFVNGVSRKHWPSKAPVVDLRESRIEGIMRQQWLPSRWLGLVC
jgi:hypothetical protein